MGSSVLKFLPGKMMLSCIDFGVLFVVCFFFVCLLYTHTEHVWQPVFSVKQLLEN